jgi:hypothetical protein
MSAALCTTASDSRRTVLRVQCVNFILNCSMVTGFAGEPRGSLSRPTITQLNCYTTGAWVRCNPLHSRRNGQDPGIHTRTRARGQNPQMAALAIGRRSARCSVDQSRRRREDDPSHCCRHTDCRCRCSGSRVRMEQIRRDRFSVHRRVPSAAEQAGASGQPLLSDPVQGARDQGIGMLSSGNALRQH